jgi:hypothetical protein
MTDGTGPPANRKPGAGKRHRIMDTNSHIEGARPGALQPAANNTDLWTVYLRGQVRNWVDPFRLADPEAVDVIVRPLADMAAAAVSSWTALFTRPVVRMLYDGNKPQVNQFVAERAIDPESIDIPADFAARRAGPAPLTQVEEWAITSIGIGGHVSAPPEPALV